MGSSVREPRIGGSSNTLQGVSQSMARAITLQAISWKWMEATSLWGRGGGSHSGCEPPPCPQKLLSPELIGTVKSNRVTKCLANEPLA
jgi:hypothetical protein